MMSDTKGFALVRIRHPCLANITLLNCLRLLIPNPPPDFGAHNLLDFEAKTKRINRNNTIKTETLTEDPCIMIG